MELQINCTANGVKTYPLHKHKHYEIMLYLEGKGQLRTEQKSIPFSPGTIIIVPPDMEHGSTSENGFKNISVGGDFQHLLYANQPVVLKDNENQEGKMLATLIFNNRYSSREYLSGLCTAYLYFLLQHMQKEDSLSAAVGKIISAITENAADPSIDIHGLLLASGYAEDYIRAHFKKMTGRTPIEFLTKIRIDQACFLINIYGKTRSLSQIAEQCGYEDYAYFSRKFKSVTGVSPRKYQLALL